MLEIPVDIRIARFDGNGMATLVMANSHGLERHVYDYVDLPNPMTWVREAEPKMRVSCSLGEAACEGTLRAGRGNPLDVHGSFVCEKADCPSIKFVLDTISKTIAIE